mmetsp:Transcript_88222/g.248316  ORF Transcript_88222/g.248316 Transcript_88222/m.248316 type:complete len:639 (+) Transcript_88222:82-1998(+)
MIMAQADLPLPRCGCLGEALFAEAWHRRRPNRRRPCGMVAVRGRGSTSGRDATRLTPDVATTPRNDLDRELGGNDDGAWRQSLVDILRRRGRVLDKERLALELLRYEDLQLQEIMVAMTALKNAGSWQAAIASLWALRERGLEVDRLLFNCALGACRDVGIDVGRALLDDMTRNCVHTDEDTHRYAIATCTSAQWPFALQLLSEMQQRGRLEAPVQAYTVAMSVARRALQWPVALVMLSEMQTAALDPDVTFYNSALWSCRGGAWRVAVDVLRCMAQNEVRPEDFTYLVTCQDSDGASDAERMLALFRRLQDCAVDVDICRFATMLMHVSSNDEWEGARRGVSSCGIELPAWRTLRRKDLDREAWYRLHRELVNTVLRSWLNAMPDRGARRESYKVLRRGLQRSTKSGEAVDFGDVAAHRGYIRKACKSWGRASHLPRMLMEPGAQSVRDRLLAKEHLVVLDIGGGPAFAALGLRLFGEVLGRDFDLEHHVVDFETTWAQPASLLSGILAERGGRGEGAPRDQTPLGRSPRTEITFHQGDLLEDSLPLEVPCASCLDLVVFQYVLHENLEPLRAAGYGVLPSLFAETRVGTIFAFLDVNDALWPEIIRLARGIGNFKVYLQLFLKREFWLMLEKRLDD